MRKLLPMLFCGVAAVSFSAVGQTSAETDKNQPQQGRSVDSGGAKPDSSKAQGAVPQTAPAAGSASTGSSSDANTGASRDEEARRKTRQGETSGIGGGTTTTGSGATTPGSTGGASSGGN